MTFLDIVGSAPFTWARLRSAGVPRSQLRRAVDDGSVRRLLQGVYVSAASADSVDLRIRAAALVIAPGHIACDRTAAWLHGIDLLSMADHAVLPPVETCVLRGNGPTQRSDVRGRSRDLLAREVMQVADLRVTTPLRTALDLGCNLWRMDALAALDAFRHQFGLTVADFHRELARFRGRRGVIQLRALLPLSDPRAESPRESWTRLALYEAGLPKPELQWWVEIDGVPTYRLDHAYPAHRVAVEYDGAEFHTDVERDRERRHELGRMGWQVIVVRTGDFTGDRLLHWTSEVRSALRDRGWSNLRW
ncbi:MAG: DUF559 domain-containing protein [Nocardioidaceae bacterium]|nr:DUF559 domain-containing protein [Nocardioidaceae bacterium]